MQVALDILEPFQAVAGGRLQAQHLQPPLVLIALEGLFHRRFRMQVIGQRDRRIKRQPRARADREMRRRRRVAHQHHVLVVPAFAQHAGKVHPHRRAAQVIGVRHQPVAAEIVREDALAGGDALFLAHLLEAPGVPGLGAAFDDHRRGALVELVGVDPHPAVFGFLEDEGEGVVEGLVRAEPDELVAPDVDLGAEGGGEFVAHARVDAVAGHHQVELVHEGAGRVELGLEPQPDAQLAGAPLQEDQHLPPPDPGESVPARDQPLPLVVHGDVVPVGEVVADRLRADGVVSLHVRQRVVRQHHAPAEGVVGAVALDHRDVMGRVTQLHRAGEIQPRRAAPETGNLHRGVLMRGFPSSGRSDSVLRDGMVVFGFNISSIK